MPQLSIYENFEAMWARDRGSAVRTSMMRYDEFRTKGLFHTAGKHLGV